MNPTTSSDALNQLQTQESQSQNPNDILSSQKQQLGVDSAQQTVNGLQGAINNTTKLLQQVAPSVMGRTGNSLVTQGQATRQIENEQAPISTNLGNEETQYNQAGQNLNQLQSQAQQAASGIYQGQQDKIGYLQNIYNSLYGKEQDTAKQAADAQAAAVQQKQFEESLAAQKSAAAASNPLNYLGGNSNSLPTGMSLKGASAGSGYNFSFGGQPVSAASFAKVSGNSLDDILYTMAQNGDKTAASAYKDILSNHGSTSPAIRAKYSSLFWGS